MINKSFGFIGGGRIVKIILRSLERGKGMPADITVSDSNIEVLDNLKKSFPGIGITQNNSDPAQKDIIFFSLHPPVFKDVLQQIKNSINNNSIFISLAPRIKSENISTELNDFKRIIRMIPNAPTIINEGYNPLFFSDSFSNKEKDELLEFFKIFGKCPEVKEDNLEAYALIAAMGPTYLWFQLYELIELGKSFGLKDKEIEETITNMVSGAVKTMFNSNLSPSEVMDLIPVKPIGEEEQNIKNIYRSKLIPLFNKLTN